MAVDPSTYIQMKRKELTEDIYDNSKLKKTALVSMVYTTFNISAFSHS